MWVTSYFPDSRTSSCPEEVPRIHRPASSVIISILGQYLKTPIRAVITERRSLCALAFVLILTDVISGCAAYNTYKKCGFRGCAGDAKITAEILSQFREHSELEPNAITVQTLDHVVYLNGLVSSNLEIATAESIARQVPGVTRVVSSVVAMTR
jgi:hypothetical protein